MDSTEALVKDNVYTTTLMPANHNRFDIPIPLETKLYLNWSINGSYLYLDLRQQKYEGVYHDNADTRLFSGVLSPSEPELVFQLDLTMQKLIPGFNLEEGKVTLLHENGVPVGLKVGGEVKVSYYSVGYQEYTF